MKIAYLGLKWNYAKPLEGTSFEFNHLEQGLKDCVADGMLEADYFHTDVDGELDILRDRLSEFDGLLFCEFNEQYDLPKDISLALKSANKFCINWSSDASWRFHNWILPRKDKFTHWITTHNQTLDWYKTNNMNVIKSQWFVTSAYRLINVEEKYDVVFLGQKYGNRGDIIDALVHSGLDIHLAGHYWEGYPNWHGYITDFQESLNFMSSGRININLSMPFHGGIPQLKGRFVQIPGLKKLQITTPADNLGEYFIHGKEIIVISSVSGLIDQCKYFIDHQDERNVIAEAGLQRTIKDHTAQNRFQEIMNQL